MWHAPPTPHADRKELLGLLVKQSALTPVDGPHRQTRVQLLWHTDATTALWGPRPSRQEHRRTPPPVVDAIAALAARHTDAAIAAVLNAQGCRSGTGQALTAAAVAWIRYTQGLRKPALDPRQAARTTARPDGRYSTRALATHCGVTIHTIHYWRERGIIPALQETPGGPWWHEVTPAILEALRQHIRRAPLPTDARDSESFLPKGAV